MGATSEKRFCMSRSNAILLLVVFCVAGCFSSRYKEKPWTEARWKESIRENEERLKPEEQRQTGGTFAFVDKAAQKITDVVVGIYNYITGNTAYNAAKDMLDPSFPDRRRAAVVYLSKRDFGRQEPYVKYYAEMARTDDDHTVRAMAIRSLNRSRRKSDTALFIATLGDEHAIVRLEAAKALANIPDEAAMAPLIKHLQERVELRIKTQQVIKDETTDVRVACADALRCHRNVEAAQALVGVLRDRDFAVSWQARESLKLMTGKDHRFDQQAWLEYLSARGGSL
jgi:hypothetical protein